MSKILPAACTAGVVTAGTPPLPLLGATVFSEGVAQSAGIAVIDENDVYYLAKTTPDVKTLLSTVIDVLTQVKSALDQAVSGLNHAASALTTIDAKPVGGTGSAPAPAAAANITAIGTAATSVTTASTQIDTLKTQLNLLKGAML